MSAVEVQEVLIDTQDPAYELLQVQDVETLDELVEDLFDQPYEGQLDDFDPELLTDPEEELDAF